MSDFSDTADPAVVDHHVKIYIRVFLALGVLTVITVAVSYLHVPFAIGVAVALFIATLKSSLVALFFMHLIDEKKMVYWILTITVLFFIVLLLMPWWWHYDDLGIN